MLESFDPEPVPEKKVVNVGIEKDNAEDPKKRKHISKEEKDKEKEEKKETVEYNYDLCDFPSQYKNKKLSNGW